MHPLPFAGLMALEQCRQNFFSMKMANDVSEMAIEVRIGFPSISRLGDVKPHMP